MPPKEEIEKGKKSPDPEPEKKKKVEAPPPAWQVGDEHKEATIKYWKVQQRSAKGEITRLTNKVNQVKKSGKIGPAEIQKLLRWSADLIRQRARATTAAEELFVLAEAEGDEFEDLEKKLTDLQNQADKMIETIDDLLSGPAPKPRAAARGDEEEEEEGDEDEEMEDDEGDDSLSIALSRASVQENQMTQVIATIYDVTSDVEKFDASKPENFENWLATWNEAEKKLDSLGKTPAEKLIALRKCLGGRPLELVSIVLGGQHTNFAGAKKTLVDYYLDRNITGKVMIDKLLKLEPMTRDPKSVEDVLFGLRQIWTSLQGLKMTGKQGQTLLFCTIAETKMSPYIRKAWSRKIAEKADPTYPIGHRATEDDLFALLNEKIKEERRVAPGRPQEKKEEKKDKLKTAIQGSFLVQESESQENPNCIVCGKNGHSAPECRTLTSIESPQERQKFLKEKRIPVCFNCMKGKHLVKNCRQPSQCGVGGCSKKHHEILHFYKQNVASGATETGEWQAEPSSDGEASQVAQSD